MTNEFFIAISLPEGEPGSLDCFQIELSVEHPFSRVLLTKCQHQDSQLQQLLKDFGNHPHD